MESISRSVVISGEEYEISLEHPVRRYEGNPVLCSHDVNSVWKDMHLKVITVHNAGITLFLSINQIENEKLSYRYYYPGPG